MKNIKKFHLNVATYFFFLLSFLCGYFKQTLFIFIIIVVHEFGHIIMIHLCKYKFLKVEFFPFGGLTHIDKPINSSINKEILIAISGVISQIFLGLILIFLKERCLTYNNYLLFQTYNFTILIFNLLPIIPLDGSIILHSILEKILPYKKAFFVYEIFSALFFLVFLYLNIILHLDNYFICGVLITQFILLKKQEKYIIRRFFLERTLKEYPYKKIKNETKLDFNSLKKETLHFYYSESHYIHEKEALEKYYWRLKK